eukprot:m.49150 g.49150  ORF g.49150 m.49150 type:complete len:1072 (+) comp12050_c0_seq2:208-3423(+)
MSYYSLPDASMNSSYLNTSTAGAAPQVFYASPRADGQMELVPAGMGQTTMYSDETFRSFEQLNASMNQPMGSERQLTGDLRTDVAAWLEEQFFGDLTAENLFEKLANGVILCRLALTIDRDHGTLFPGRGHAESSVPLKFKVDASPGDANSRHNVHNFLYWARAAGMDEEFIFRVDDLVMHQNQPRVLKCLVELMRLQTLARGGAVDNFNASMHDLELSGMRETTDTLQKIIAELKAQINELHAHEAETDIELVKLEGELAEAHAQLAQQRRLVDRHKGDVDKLGRRGQTFDDEMQTLKASMAELQVERNHLAGLRSHLESQAEDLKRKLAEHQAAKDLLSVQVQELNDSKLQLSKDMGNLEQHKRELLQQIAGLESRVANGEKMLQELRDKHAQELADASQISALTHGELAERLERTKTDHGDELERRQKQHAQTLDGLHQKHASQLEQMRLANDKLMQEMRDEHAARIADLERQLDERDMVSAAEMDEKLRAKDEEMQQRDADAQQRLAELHRSNEEKLSTANARHDAQVQALKQTIEDNEKARAKLLDDQEAMHARNAEQIDELRRKHEQELEDARNEHSQHLENTRQEHEQVMARHSTSLDETHSQHQQERDAYEQQLREQQEQHQRQLEEQLRQARQQLADLDRQRQAEHQIRIEEEEERARKQIYETHSDWSRRHDEARDTHREQLDQVNRVMTEKSEEHAKRVETMRDEHETEKRGLQDTHAQTLRETRDAKDQYLQDLHAQYAIHAEEVEARARHAEAAIWRPRLVLAEKEIAKWRTRSRWKGYAQAIIGQLAYEKRISDLEGELTVARSMLDITRKGWQETEKELKRLQKNRVEHFEDTTPSKSASGHDEVQTAEQKVISLSKELGQVRSRLTEMQQKYNDKELAFHRLEKDLEMTTEELQEKERQIHDDRLTRELGAGEGGDGDMAVKVHDLQKRVKELEEENDTLLAENDTLERTMDDMREEFNGAMTELDRIKKQREAEKGTGSKVLARSPTVNRALAPSSPKASSKKASASSPTTAKKSSSSSPTKTTAKKTASATGSKLKKSATGATKTKTRTTKKT